MATRKTSTKGSKRTKAKADESAPLFTQTDAMPPPARPAAWHLATNHLNLLHMFGSGLVTSPAGLGDKYYTDALATFPGWVPFFRTEVPVAALSLAAGEADHLRACVAEFDLGPVRSPAFAASDDGDIRQVEFPGESAEQGVAVLLPTPIPVALLKRVSFASDPDRSAFEERARDAANIDLRSIELIVDAARFDNASQTSWPPASGPEARHDLDGLITAQSAGGTLAMLHNIANRSDLALAAYRIAFRQATPRDSRAIARDAVLAELPTWLEKGTISAQAETPARLYWGVIDAIIHARREGIALRPIDQTLRFLESELPGLQEETFKPRLERLLRDMRGISGFGAGTVSELFERHKGSLSRPLLMFCLRESCEELMEFTHPSFGDADLILSAILFGARDGWIGLPNSLRQPGALARNIGLRMAEIASRHARSRISFEPSTQPPAPLRELFDHEDGNWSQPQKDAALDLARSAKWIDCIKTRVSFGKGEYRLSVDASGVHVLLDGDVKAVLTQPDMDTFMQALGTRSVDLRIENIVRERLNAKA